MRNTLYDQFNHLNLPCQYRPAVGKTHPPASPLSFGLAGIGLPANRTDPLLINDANAVSIAAQPPVFPSNGSLLLNKFHSALATVRGIPYIFRTTGFAN
jgi:hypothetical protein